MSELPRSQMERRFTEFPDEIRNIGRANALVHRIMECYTHGDIITREEALCRMIVELARDWERSRKDYETTMLMAAHYQSKQ